MSMTHYAQFCALARAAEILGQRWTLLIVRELLLGPKRFGDLLVGLSSVSPTVLTGRLDALVEQGIVKRATLPPPYGTQVYELTDIGFALKPAIYALIRWGGFFLFPMRSDDEFQPDWVLLALDAIARRSASPAVTLRLTVTHKSKSATFLVEGGPHGTRLTKGEGEAKTSLETRFDVLLRLIAGALPMEEAIAEGLARVEGSVKVASTLPRLFELQTRTRI